MENNSINTLETYTGNPRYELRFDFSVNTVDAYIEVLPTQTFTLYGHGTCDLYDKEAGDFVQKDIRLRFEYEFNNYGYDNYEFDADVRTLEGQSVSHCVEWYDICCAAQDYLIDTFDFDTLKWQFIDGSGIDLTEIRDNYGFLVVRQAKRRTLDAHPELLRHIYFYK